MKLPDHPSTHGHHVNPYGCGRGEHRGCSGFSGGYDTYMCGCCCHDLERPDSQATLTDADRTWIRRVRGFERDPA